MTGRQHDSATRPTTFSEFDGPHHEPSGARPVGIRGIQSRRGLSLAAVIRPHFTSFIARRNEMKTKFRAALISAAFLSGSIVAGAAYSGNLLKANGVSTEADAIQY